MCQSNAYPIELDAFENPLLYNIAISALLYLTLTRPDIAFQFNKLSQLLQAPTTDHQCAFKIILMYLKGSLDTCIFFRRHKVHQYLRRSSILLLIGKVVYMIVALQLAIVSTLMDVQSAGAQETMSYEAEYRAIAEAIFELIWLKSLLKLTQMFYDVTMLVRRLLPLIMYFMLIQITRRQRFALCLSSIKLPITLQKLSTCFTPQHSARISILLSPKMSLRAVVNEPLCVCRFTLLAFLLALSFALCCLLHSLNLRSWRIYCANAGRARYNEQILRTIHM